MKIHLVNTNYIFDHKLFKLWKYPAILYGILLIFKTTNGLKELQEYENLFRMISTCFISTGFIFFLLNMFVYGKIGELIVKNDKLFIKKYHDQVTEIDLEVLESVTIGKDKGKFYSVTINELQIEVILDKTDLENFTELLSRNDVVVKDMYLYERILKLIKVNK